MERPPTIPELVESLRLSFQKSDFARAEALLLVMDAERQRLRSELALRTATENPCSEGRKAAEAEQLEATRRMLGEVEGRVRGYEEENVAWRKREEMYKYRILELEEDMKRKDASEEELVGLKTVNRELEVANAAASEEAATWKNRYGELEMVLKRLEEEGLEMKGMLSQKEDRIMKLQSKLKREQLVPTNGNLKFEGNVGGLVDKKRLETVCEGSVEIIEGMNRVIDYVVISESEDDDDVFDHGCAYGGKREIGAVGNGGDGKRLEMLDFGYIDEREEGEQDGVSRQYALAIPTPKRKRASRVVVSDSEEEDSIEDYDNVPIETLKLKKLREVNGRDEGITSHPANNSPDSYFSGSGGCMHHSATPSKRRLMPMRQCRGAKNGEVTLTTSSIAENVTFHGGRRRLTYPLTGISEEDDVRSNKDVEDATSESETDGLCGFIVNDSAQSDSESTENDEFGEVKSKSISNDNHRETGAWSDTSEESNGDLDMKKLLSRISREKKSLGWEYESDMLSSFSRDPELCLKAVCALYRQQTNEEQSLMLTVDLNGRGFNKLDATSENQTFSDPKCK